jgi:formylglycine-generating enzyme required for sulfatase activity
MQTNTAPPTAGTTRNGMAWIPAGTFLMGSDLPEYPEEGPPHQVSVDGFWIDETTVTKAQFRRFVKATGYRTVAERPLDPAEYPGADPALLVPGSLVFTPTRGPADLSDWQNWWRYVPGANWAHPEGPQSTIAGRELHPVTHVCWEDVAAYAAWAGKELPTEAEWEYAARGGLDGALYTWGNQFQPLGQRLANYWVGEFPWQNLKPLAEQRTVPVRSFPANGYGLFDMAGNVWEWTADYYRADHAGTATHACCPPPVNPRITEAEGSFGTEEQAGAHVPRQVIKGGSHLCAENYCQRYRPAARQAQQVESGMSHIGFRCIVRPSAGGAVG